MRVTGVTSRASLGGLAALLALAPLACGRRHAEVEPPRRLAVSVFADTGRGERLHIVPPATPGREPARVWLTQVTPSRPPALDLPLPAAAPSPVEDSAPTPPALAVDPDLKPPILKTPGLLHIPAHARRGWVELDVRVGEDGSVTDAIWAGGSPDSSLTEAATACALAMRFYPALRAGRPTAVWCRQRFDFAGRRD
jgi:TonB family protein